MRKRAIDGRNSSTSAAITAATTRPMMRHESPKLGSSVRLWRAERAWTVMSAAMTGGFYRRVPAWPSHRSGTLCRPLSSRRRSPQQQALRHGRRACSSSRYVWRQGRLEDLTARSGAGGGVLCLGEALALAGILTLAGVGRALARALALAG